MHVLNFCHPSLDRFKWRHDNVLVKLKEFVESALRDTDEQVLCDVVSANGKLETNKSVNTIPPEILITSQRPDMTIINKARREIKVVELTIPFECNIEQAQERKSAKYAPLLAGLQEVGYKCTYFSIELGARGVVSYGTSKTLKQMCGASRLNVRNFLRDISRTVIQCSFLIFKAKDCGATKFDFIL